MKPHATSRRPGWAALLLGALLLLWALHDPLALGQAGTVAVQQGEVKIRHDGRSQLVKAPATGVPVFAGDAMHSGPDTLAVITLTGGTQQDKIQLYGNSFFTLDSVSESESRSTLGIGKALFSVFARLKSGARFEVKTPTAVIGVKGTEFVVGTDGETTYVLTLTGAVGLVSNVLGELREVTVTQDTVSAARFNQAPVPPSRVSPDTRDRAVKEQGIGTFKGMDLKGKEEKEKGPTAAPQKSLDVSTKVSDTQETLKERTQDVPQVGGGSGSLKFRLDFTTP